jgi:hypothetical protein
MVISSFTVVGKEAIEQSVRVKILLTGGNSSDERGQGKLHVLLQPGDADADEP